MDKPIPCPKEHYIQHLAKRAHKNIPELETKYEIKELMKEIRDGCTELGYIDTQLIRDFNLNGVYDKSFNHFISDEPGKEDLRCLFSTEKEKTIRKNKCYKFVGFMDFIAFKPYNDFLGNDAGDVILAFAADFMKDYLEKCSLLVVRKGGEEYLAYNINPNFVECIHKNEFNSSKYKKYQNADSLKEALSACNEKLEQEEACFYIPAYGSSKKRSLLYNKGEPQNIGDPFNDFMFRFFIKGIQFRYGVGTTVEEAGDDCTNAKNNETGDKLVRRGEFGTKVEFAFFDSQQAGKENRWLSPNEYIFITLTKEIADSVEAVKSLLEVSKEDVFYDNDYKTFHLAVKFKSTNRAGDNVVDILKKLEDSKERYKNSFADENYEQTELLIDFVYNELKSLKRSDDVPWHDTLKSVAKYIARLGDNFSVFMEIIKSFGDGDEQEKRSAVMLLEKHSTEESRGNFLKRVADKLYPLGESVCLEVFLLSGESIWNKYFDKK